MTTIIAGMFDTVAKAASAVDRLLEGEFGDRDVYSFANNPPGQHATFPIGGDEDPGARHADAQTGEGSAAGLGTGGAIGAVAAGPPGAAIGADVGSLVGALHGKEDRGTDDHPVRGPAGTLVAVRIDSGHAEQAAISTLQMHGAIHVGKAQGVWRDGQWVDYDPVSMPMIVDAPAAAASPQFDDQKGN